MTQLPNHYLNKIGQSTQSPYCKMDKDSVANLTQIFAPPLPVSPLVKECACFYCHLAFFVRNKLIFRCFKIAR